MPTVADEERPARDAEPPPAEPRPDRMLRGRTAVVAVVAASVATVGVVVASLMIDDDRPAQTAQAPVTVGQPPPTAVSMQPPAPRPAPPAPRPAVAPAFAMDDRGFVNSPVRCDGAQSAVAIGRTTRSIVVVCGGPDGRYRYIGMRLTDGAALRLDDVRVIARGFEARGDGATYLISADELVAMSGDAVLTRDPMIDYRTPRPAR